MLEEDLVCKVPLDQTFALATGLQVDENMGALGGRLLGYVELLSLDLD